jgi:hypothetical protein
MRAKTTHWAPGGQTESVAEPGAESNCDSGYEPIPECEPERACGDAQEYAHERPHEQLDHHSRAVCVQQASGADGRAGVNGCFKHGHKAERKPDHEPRHEYILKRSHESVDPGLSPVHEPRHGPDHKPDPESDHGSGADPRTRLPCAAAYPYLDA